MAVAQIKRVSHSMLLENQSLVGGQDVNQIKELKKSCLRNHQKNYGTQNEKRARRFWKDTTGLIRKANLISNGCAMVKNVSHLLLSRSLLKRAT